MSCEPILTLFALDGSPVLSGMADGAMSSVLGSLRHAGGVHMLVE